MGMIARFRGEGRGGMMIARNWCVCAWPLLTLFGCTTLTKEYEAPPPERTSIVAVGHIDPSCTEWERDALRFQRSLNAELRASGAFSEVRSSVRRSLPADALIISGTVLGADGGSDLQQALLGIGGPAAQVEVRVSDGQDRVLLVFDQSSLIARKHLNVRSWSPLEVNDLMDDLAADAARSIVRWSEGKPISDTLF